jgi:hypothetical protein
MADDNDMPMGDAEYGDGGEAPADDKEMLKDEKSDDGKDDGGQEAILPTSILAGKDFQVGDEVVLKITAMHDDSISVKYAPSKGKDEGDDKAAVPAGMGGGDEDY